MDLELALANGAKLLRLYSALDFGRSDLSSSLFAPMMLPLARGKLVAKGRGGRTDAELASLCAEWAKIGVQVQPSDFQEGKPALYILYKLLMVVLPQSPPPLYLEGVLPPQNSLWGKMGQANRSREKEYVSSPTQAAKIIG